MTDEEIATHKCFTVDGTAYLRNLDREDLRGPCVAIHHQSKPKRTENGTSFGLRYPMLILANYIDDADAVAQRVADILNKHWAEA